MRLSLALHELRSTPMMRAAMFPSCTSPAVRCLTITACGTWYGPRRDPTICSVSGVRVLALVGLLVGILMVALQGAPVIGPLPDAPRDSLALGDDDPDDNSSPWAILTAEVPSLTLAPVIRGVTDLKHTGLRLFRYLTRPHLLTRC
jgi:hypothetical protein